MNNYNIYNNEIYSYFRDVENLKFYSSAPVSDFYRLVYSFLIYIHLGVRRGLSAKLWICVLPNNADIRIILFHCRINI